MDGQSGCMCHDGHFNQKTTHTTAERIYTIQPYRQKNLLQEKGYINFYGTTFKTEVNMDIGHQVLTKESDEIQKLIKVLKQISDLLDNESNIYRPVLNGERYLTEQEVSEALKLSKRTLIEYRMSGKMTYYKIGGKVLYRENDILKILEDNKIAAFNR